MQKTGAHGGTIRASKWRLDQNTGGGLGTPGKSLPVARTNRGPERSVNITKSGANSADWYTTKKVVTEDRMRWVMNSFMPHQAPGLDGI